MASTIFNGIRQLKSKLWIHGCDGYIEFSFNPFGGKASVPVDADQNKADRTKNTWVLRTVLIYVCVINFKLCFGTS